MNNRQRIESETARRDALREKYDEAVKDLQTRVNPQDLDALQAIQVRVLASYDSLESLQLPDHEQYMNPLRRHHAWVLGNIVRFKDAMMQYERRLHKERIEAWAAAQAVSAPIVPIIDAIDELPLEIDVSAQDIEILAEPGELKPRESSPAAPKVRSEVHKILSPARPSPSITRASQRYTSRSTQRVHASVRGKPPSRGHCRRRRSAAPPRTERHDEGPATVPPSDTDLPPKQTWVNPFRKYGIYGAPPRLMSAQRYIPEIHDRTHAISVHIPLASLAPEVVDSLQKQERAVSSPSNATANKTHVDAINIPCADLYTANDSPAAINISSNLPSVPGVEEPMPTEMDPVAAISAAVDAATAPRSVFQRLGDAQPARASTARRVPGPSFTRPELVSVVTDASLTRSFSEFWQMGDIQPPHDIDQNLVDAINRAAIGSSSSASSEPTTSSSNALIHTAGPWPSVTWPPAAKRTLKKTRRLRPAKAPRAPPACPCCLMFKIMATHLLGQCPHFVLFTIPERQELVETWRVCQCCWRYGHHTCTAADCGSPICKPAHHALLCPHGSLTTEFEANRRNYTETMRAHPARSIAPIEPPFCLCCITYKQYMTHSLWECQHFLCLPVEERREMHYTVSKMGDFG